MISRVYIVLIAGQWHGTHISIEYSHNLKLTFDLGRFCPLTNVAAVALELLPATYQQAEAPDEAVLHIWRQEQC